MQKICIVFITSLFLFSLIPISFAGEIRSHGQQTISANPPLLVTIKKAGTANGLARGVCYTVLPDPTLTTPIPTLGDETVAPTEFKITTDARSSVSIDFILPTLLVGPQGQMGCSFSTHSLLEEDQGTTFDPNVANTFAVGAAGTIDLGLGLNVCVPTAAEAGDYVGTIICHVAASGPGDIAGSDRGIARTNTHRMITTDDTIAVEFTVTIVPVLTIATKTEGVGMRLQRGITYTISPDPALHSPVPDSNGESSAPTEFTVATDAGANVTVSFILPTRLVGPQSEFGCSFGTNALMHEGLGATYNPNVANTFLVGSDGTFDLGLGIAISVPESAEAGVYRGTVICQAQVSGMLGSNTARVTPMDHRTNFATAGRKAQPIVTISAIVTAYVGTEDGVKERQPQPKNSMLLQNYPNPFNPTTDFGYRIADFGLVRLSVFDVLGREVAILVNEVKSPGEYYAVWNASGMPSGMYAYRLDATSSGDPGKHFSRTRKMLLVR